MGHASMFGYAGGAALAVLLATAAMHFLLVTTPRPMWFFRWLAGVGTAIAVLLPLGLTQELPAGLATATVNLILGLMIIGLVRSTAAASLRSSGLPQRLQTLRLPRDENDESVWPSGNRRPRGRRWTRHLQHSPTNANYAGATQHAYPSG